LQHLLTEADLLAQSALEVLGDQLQFREIGEIHQHDDEFIAADAGDHAIRGNGSGNAKGCRPEHGVAGRMTVAVVDLLELVEVEMQDRERRDPLVGRQLREPLVEKAPVRQAGEIIVIGDMLDARIAFLECQRPRLGHQLLPRQLRVELYVGSHIPFGADEGRRPLRIHVEMRARAQMADFAARQHDPELRIIGAPCRNRVVEVAFGLLAIVGMDGIRPEPCRHLPERLAGLVEPVHLRVP